MSSEAHSQQVPINGTVQHMVEPGTKTNLYYILISNLPWQTSWQQLKDHVRTVCSVDRVEVFNDSTSGWVCVKGRENFDVAFQLLNGGIFNDRALCADGKNATDPIMIKELVGPCASPRSPLTPRHATAPSSHYTATTSPMVQPPAVSYGEWNSHVSAPTGMMPSTGAAAIYSPPLPYDYTEGTAHFPYETTPTTQTYTVSGNYAQYPPEASYGQYQVGDYHNNGYTTYGNTASSSGYGSERPVPLSGVVPTRQRKIIVKQLPTSATREQVLELFKMNAGRDADQIQRIDLPMASNRNLNRGYALATFWNEDTANDLVQKLNGQNYGGNILRAQLTKEEVSDFESSNSRASGHHSHHSHRSHSNSHSQPHSHRERRDNKERREKKESYKPSSSSDSKSTKPHKMSVIIAHGTSTSSKKLDDRDKKHGRKH
ncbi:hypothetical protein F4778DRAFT_175915 [Xylariomycetidae sp. FL2044]|nr:hypothetical protein F4778DRAFT_175915 [Xylariomycetidae sp. FL2044]